MGFTFRVFSMLAQLYHRRGRVRRSRSMSGLYFSWVGKAPTQPTVGWGEGVFFVFANPAQPGVAISFLDEQGGIAPVLSILSIPAMSG